MRERELRDREGGRKSKCEVERGPKGEKMEEMRGEENKRIR